MCRTQIIFAITTSSVAFCLYGIYGNNAGMVYSNPSSVVMFPSDVRAILESNVAGLNPIILEWTQKRSPNMDVESFVKRLNAGPGLLRIFEPERYFFIWQDGCVFLQTKFGTSTHVTAKDHENYYTYGEEERISAINTVSAFPLALRMEKYSHDSTFVQPYLPFLGIRLPSKSAELNEKPTSYISFLLENGNLVNYSEVDLEGMSALRVDIESNVSFIEIPDGVHVFSFWLVPKHNFAVARLEIKQSPDKLLLRAVNSDFKKITGTTVWIPYRTKVDYYVFANQAMNHAGGPFFMQEFFLSDVSTRKTDISYFDLRKKFQQPGNLVGDRTLLDTNGGLMYVVPANPADLDRVIESALTGKDFVPTPLQSPWASPSSWVLAIVGLCLIIYSLVSMYIKHSQGN